tara:strand:+ start:177 stop:668 length:492 start_codon:yes stop_codon:yes gene_type:complete
VRQDRLIFGCIPEILTVHGKLLAELDALVSSSPREESKELIVGDVLLAWIPTLNVYEKYAKTVDSARVLLERLFATDSTFYEIVEQCKLSTVYKGYRGLYSLLVTPLQRLMRYVILTKALLKQTSPEHADYEPLSHALESIGVMVDHINKVHCLICVTELSGL